MWLEGQQDGPGKAISAQTVKHILSDARCFFRWAEDSGYLERSPFPRRLMPKIQEQPPKRLTDEEVEKLLAIPEPWAFVIRLGLGTGMRWSEMARARADHVERRGDDTVLVVSHTKSGKIRRIRLPHELAAEIRGRVGLLMPQANYWQAVLKIRRLSGVAEFRPHRLRQTFAARWIERNGSLAVLQELLGHADITTTIRYARLLDVHVWAEAERLEGRSGTEAGTGATSWPLDAVGST